VGQSVAGDRGRLVALDGVRGLAIAMVVLFHITNGASSNRITKAITRVTGAGWLGVELFFALSAFLITTQLAKRPAPGAYANRRVRRIVPMYAVVLVLFLVIAPLITAGLRHADVHNAFAHTIPQTDGVSGVQWTFVLFAQNGAMFMRNAFLHPSLGVTWSLAVEVQFYVAWFFLMRRDEQFVKRVAIVAIVAGPLWRALMALSGADVARIYVGPLSHLDLFGWGTLLAFWYRRGTEVRWLRSRTTIVAAASALGGWLLLADRPLGQTGMQPGQLSIGITIAAVLIAACVHRVLTHGGTLGQVLAWRPLTGLGLISYSLYLLHTSVELVFRRVVMPETSLGTFVRHHDLVGQLALFVLIGGAAVVLSIVTYRLIEAPFLRQPQRVRRAAQPPRPVAAEVF
jgi:peptidoglycan/LPS O-acetylase OafA/YrhL